MFNVGDKVKVKSGIYCMVKNEIDKTDVRCDMGKWCGVIVDTVGKNKMVLDLDLSTIKNKTVLRYIEACREKNKKCDFYVFDVKELTYI